MVNIGKIIRCFFIATAALGASVTSTGCPVDDGVDFCASTRDCCDHSPSALCTEDGYCESNVFCAQDPACYGSRFGVCEAITPPLPPPPPGNPCADIAPVTWNGLLCSPLGPSEHALLDRLTSIWHTGPTTACGYDGRAGGQGACGPLSPGNAFYCPIDDMIAYDFNFMNQQLFMYGDFAPVVIMAHEWGHLNQGRLGWLAGGSSKGLELHADCQAGVFAAIEEVTGRLQMGDVCEAFYSLCAAGDPYMSPWFEPGAHGTCEERVQAFEFGYLSARENLAGVCGPAPIEAMLAICGS